MTERIKSAAIVMIAALLLYSCCKTRTIVETRSYQLPNDTDTVFVSVPGKVPAIESEPLKIALRSLCDSINRGLLIQHSSRGTGRTRNPGERQLVASAQIDTSGILSLLCREDEFRLKVDSLVQLNVKQKEVIETMTKTVVRDPLFGFFRTGFFALLIACFILFLFLKKG